MRPNVLVDLFLQFDPKLNLVFKALAYIAVGLLELVQLQFQVLLVSIQLPDVKVKLLFHLSQGFLVLSVHLSELHLVAAAAAVLEQDRVDLPDRGEYRVLVLCVVQRLVHHLVEANRVDEEAAVDAVDGRHIHVL